MATISNSIWLTGDVHHMSMKGTDHLLLSKKNIKTTEVDLCDPYLEICNQYGFKPTLFFTGKSIEQESKKIQKLISKYKFNIGGHTFATYQPILFSKFSRKLFGSPYYSKQNQYNDIIKTKNIINKKLGVKIKYWRNHAYQFDKYTNNILSQEGFTRVSNIVDTKLNFIEKISNNLFSYPINTLPDHENLPHSIEHKNQIDPNIWLSKNIKYVKNIINHDGTATLLLHPLCMFLEDNFSFMIKLLSKLSKYN
jgi:hypothetical protein